MIRKAARVVADHALMIIFSVIVGMVFAVWLAGYGR